MLQTSLSAKESLPNQNPLKAPIGSKKKGSLLQPAKKRWPPPSETVAFRSKETAAPSISNSPSPSAAAACGPVINCRVAVCPSEVKGEKTTRYVTSARLSPLVSIFNW
jgi:hypothetical protein